MEELLPNFGNAPHRCSAPLNTHSGRHRLISFPAAATQLLAALISLSQNDLLFLLDVGGLLASTILKTIYLFISHL